MMCFGSMGEFNYPDMNPNIRHKNKGCEPPYREEIERLTAEVEKWKARANKAEGVLKELMLIVKIYASLLGYTEIVEKIDGGLQTLEGEQK